MRSYNRFLENMRCKGHTGKITVDYEKKTLDMQVRMNSTIVGKQQATKVGNGLCVAETNPSCVTHK